MQNNKQAKLSFSSLSISSKLILVSVLIMGFSLCCLLKLTWDTRLDYSFGYLAPIFVLYIIYDRFPNIKKTLEASPLENNRGINIFCDVLFSTMLFCGLTVFGFFSFVFYKTMNWGVPSFGMAFGFAFTFFALMYFFCDKNIRNEKLDIYTRLSFLTLFVFPCFIWLVAAPTFAAVEKRISLFLLGKVATVVVSIMDMLGYVVSQHGNTISFPKGTVGVADACSGIRSLTACLFAGSFLAAALLNKFWKKILLVGLSMLLAFFFNLIRALFLTFWAYENGSESINGFVHDAAGYFVLGMTVVGLLIFTSIFNFNPIPKEFRDENKSEE